MRCYHLNNMYLAGIHAGIQTAHTQHELAIKYLGEHSAASRRSKELYRDWAENEKTIIVLNGGMAKHLLDFQQFLQDNESDLDLPWASFCEEEAALNGAMTNVGIVLPEHLYAYTGRILKALDEAERRPDVRQKLEDMLYTFSGLEQGRTALLGMFEDDLKLRVYNRDASYVTYSYKPAEIELMRRINALRLFGA